MKKIMMAALVFAALATTGCNKCTSCTVYGTYNGKEYQETYDGLSKDGEISADDCKALKQKAEQAANVINNAAALLGSKDKVAVRCN